MASDTEDADMERDEGVAKCGETKPPVGCDENEDAGDAGRCFKPPGQAVIRLPARPKDHGHDHCQQSEMTSWNRFHFRARSTARVLAAIMLSGRARFFPAISKAVP